MMTVPSDWLCPLCGRANTANHETCAHCQYWHRDEPPLIPAKIVGSTERPLAAPESLAPPFPGSYIESRRPRGVSRGGRGGHRRFGGPLRVVWAGIVACGLAGASLGLGWWLGLGASAPLQRQLQAADRALATATRAPVRTVVKTRIVQVPVVHTVDKTHTVYQTRTVYVPAASPTPYLAGTWGATQPIEVPVTLTNLANGARIQTVAELDTGSFGVLVTPGIAEDLGLPVLTQSAIGGVGGIGPSTVYGGSSTVQLGPFTWRNAGLNTLSPYALPTGVEVLLGRNFLSATGLQLRTTGATWALVVPNGTAGY